MIVLYDNVTKKYSDDCGVFDISFAIEKKAIVGLLGRNGAGKTTIIKLMMNLIHQDSGNIRIFSKAYCKNEKNIKENTKAIICTHASNLTGNIMDIEKIGKICKENNLIFIVDASQSAGSIPVDIEKQNIDVLCFTGHKSLYGAQGTGGLYVREGILIDPLKVGGSGIDTYNTEHPAEMPERLEAGTLNSHGIAGLRAGLDFINKTGLEKIHGREKELMWRFYNGVKDIKNIKIYGEYFDTDGRAIDRISIVTINLGDIDSAEICDILNEEYDIVTRAGGHCAPLMHKALGTEVQGAVRFSFSYFNTEEEIDTAINAIKEIVELF
mgnify:CR=1 FL=1